jgi:hypothetical protein
MLLLLACTPTTPKDSTPELPFRVAILADPHIIGPNYECCSENGDLDNNSIMQTVARLDETVDRLNAVEPAPVMAFVLGDIVHDAHVYESLAEYEGQDSAWSRAGAAFSRLEMPWYLALGNHDYDFSCGDPGDPHEITHQLAERYLNTPPYQRVDHGEWSFFLANTQLGPTFELGHPLCDGGSGSLGAEQLAWLAEGLGEGRPSIVMSHHYPLVIEKNEDPEGLVDFEYVLSNAPNVKVALSGHSHRWIDFGEAYPFHNILVGGTRYDSDNFWILEFQPDGGDFSILDFDKPEWTTLCAETWLYDGNVVEDPSHPAETGDCGN